MIFAGTGRSPFDYNGYGCHCGKGGHGKALDDVDRCCETHDRCYKELKDRRICSGWGIYIVHYKTSSPLECAKTNTGCGKGLCECDRDAVLCFKEKKYNRKYKELQQTQVLLLNEILFYKVHHNGKMKIIVFIFIILITQNCSNAAYATAGRFKRDLLSFNHLIRVITKRNPLDFNGYGCYCGAGGHGRPVDLLDRCCKSHDECYGRLGEGGTFQKKVCGWGIYFRSYKLIGSPPTCRKGGSACSYGLCKCDISAAFCFAKRPFNPKYKNYNKKRC
ncbi:phospholipase A2-like [Dendronephthya gigantea]|uniref:phospholipase A2-like n=1 Tax=Dendronephthya gigantea TaxID=151771 RepID=UPI00106D57A9|nr:phospholipase A2-like [Dendronephthya gigantea]